VLQFVEEDIWGASGAREELGQEAGKYQFCSCFWWKDIRCTANADRIQSRIRTREEARARDEPKLAERC
jgi:hypothetical protein